MNDLKSSYELSEMYLQDFLNAPKKVQQLILMPLIDQHFYPTVLCEEIKSPIEQIFITAFDLYIMQENKKNIFLFPQASIETSNKKYIVDFLFLPDEFVNSFDTDRKIIIECDGHEFHQKTKEQVVKDNEREYDLKMAGYEIIRFSGSQIFNDPLKCAENAYIFITKDLKEE